MNTGLEISSCCAKTNSLKLVHENIWTSCRFNVRIKLQQTYGGDQRLKELIGMRIQTFQEELRETVLPFMFLSFLGGVCLFVQVCLLCFLTDQVCTGKLLSVLSRHYQDVTCLKFTDDSSHFVSGGKDNLALVWSLSR